MKGVEKMADHNQMLAIYQAMEEAVGEARQVTLDSEIFSPVSTNTI